MNETVNANKLLDLFSNDNCDWCKEGRIDNHSLKTNSRSGECISVTNIAYVPSSARNSSSVRFSKVWVSERESSTDFCVSFLPIGKVEEFMQKASKMRIFPMEDLVSVVYSRKQINKAYEDMKAFFQTTVEPTGDPVAARNFLA